MEFFSGEDTLYAEVLEPVLERKSVSGSDASAATLVLLHPTPLNHAFWQPVAHNLPAYRRVLPDLRGHGESPLGVAPVRVDAEAPVLTIEQLARDTVAMLDTLGIERAVFVGCSIGGYTLYELWRTVPERVAGLVFCSSKPQDDTEPERAKRGEWITKMEPLRLAGELRPAPDFVEAMLATLLAQPTQRDRPELVQQVRLMLEQVRPEAVQAIQRGLGRRPDGRLAAGTVSVPSCVIASEEDRSSTPDDLVALYSTLRDGGSRSEYHLLRDAGHYGPLEQPDETAAILTAFLASL